MEATTDKSKTEIASANEMLAAGGALAVFGTLGTLLTGAVCPVCVVGTPLLLGGGVVKKIRKQFRKNKSIRPLQPGERAG